MRSIRSALAIVIAVVALGALAPAVAASPEPAQAHIVKDCHTYNGEIPSLCTIAVSDLAVIPPGTKVWYDGPVLTNNYFLSSKTRLDAGGGNTATGYCIYETVSTKGICTFWEGTGSLAGFYALFDVTVDAEKLWHWDGMFYGVKDAPRRPSPDDRLRRLLDADRLRPTAVA